MIEYHDELIVGMSPHWRLRPDYGQGLVYKHSLADLVWKLISIPVAVAICLMDGRRTASEITDQLAALLDLQDRAEATIFVQGAIGISNEADEPFLVEVLDDQTEITRVNLKKFLELLNSSNRAQRPKIGQLQVPIQMLFMPTFQCETNCIYCYAERRPVPKKEQLPAARWCELIDECARLGIDLVMFSGGDPLLYPHIDLLLERLSKREIEFLVPTKAYVPPSRARRLTQLCADVGTIQISIDGVTPEIIDEMIGRKGYCEGAWATLENFIDAGARVRTQSVMTPINVGDAEALVRRLHALGVPESNLVNYSRSFFRHSDALFLSAAEMDQLQKVVSQTKDELNWDGVTCNVGINDPTTMTYEEKYEFWPERAGCSGGKSSMGITPDGSVILCEQMPQEGPFIVGNVKDQSLMDVWRSREVAEFVVPAQELFQGTPCFECDIFYECHQDKGRCFRDAYFMFGNLFHPPPNCPYAPEAARMG